jgi:hypothetical protein
VTLGPEGGTITHPAHAQLVVPVGALDESTRLCLAGAAAPSSGSVGEEPLGQAFDATPADQALRKPVDILVPFDAARLRAGMAIANVGLRMAPASTSDFVSLQSSADLAKGMVRAQTLHFAQFVPALNPNPVFITSAPSLPRGTVGVAYAQSFTATGGTTPYAWSVSPLSATPPGLLLGAGGALGGTPTVPSNYAFFVTVADTASHGVQMATSLTVVAATNPVPVLSQIAPASAVQGAATTTILMTGSAFAPTAQALWDDIPIPTTFVSASKLAAAIPAANLVASGAHHVAVSNPAPGGGTSASIAFTVGAIPQNPIPSLASVSPTEIPASTVDTPITMTGASFLPTSVAVIGAQGIPTMYVSATKLVATIPASFLGAAGVLNLGVFNPPPGGGFSATTIPVTVGALHPVPVLVSLAPSSVPASSGAFTLTATGSGFVLGGQLFFGSTALPTTVTSATNASAPVAATLVAIAGSTPITFVNPTPGGGASAPLPFTITSAEPDAGPSDAGPIDSGTPDASGSVTWRSLHAGIFASYALAFDGAAYGWGSVGTLGNGTVVAESVLWPTRAANGKTFDQLSVADHACGITGGDLFCWGSNDVGQTGGSNGTCNLAPCQTVPLAILPGTKFARVSSGRTQTCAITTAGTLTCWGSSGTTSSVPTGTYKEVASSQDLACALDTNGIAHCWGPNSASFGSLAQRPLTTISADFQMACGVGTGGEGYCWGTTGTCYVGTMNPGPSPSLLAIPGGVPLIDIQAGCFASCALATTGTVYCWGRGSNGALGVGDTTFSTSTPVPIPGLPPMASIAVSNGAEWACGLTAGGERWCWGTNFEGQLGDGTTTRRASPERSPASPVDGGAPDAATDAPAPLCPAINTTFGAYVAKDQISPISASATCFAGATPELRFTLDGVVVQDWSASAVLGLPVAQWGPPSVSNLWHTITIDARAVGQTPVQASKTAYVIVVDSMSCVAGSSCGGVSSCTGAPLAQNQTPPCSLLSCTCTGATLSCSSVALCGGACTTFPTCP